MTTTTTTTTSTSRRLTALIPPLLVSFTLLSTLLASPSLASPLLAARQATSTAAPITLSVTGVPTISSVSTSSTSSSSIDIATLTFPNGSTSTSTATSSATASTATVSASVNGTSSTGNATMTSTQLPTTSQLAGGSAEPARKGEVAFFDPYSQPGGQMLTIIPGPTTVGLGEPINVIVSGKSSPSVLTVEGFLLWATSINFGVSCLGQANGTQQLANLGDGRGNVTQGNGNGDNGVLRWNYGDPYLGTCKETFQGGNHFRWWIQNGTDANSGAFFLATSNEGPLSTSHMIVENGYNTGRDELVGNATQANGTQWEGNVYNTTVEWIEAGVMLNASSEGVNHPVVALPGQPNQDGRIAVLTVTQLRSGEATNAAQSLVATSLERSTIATVVAVLATLALSFSLLV